MKKLIVIMMLMMCSICFGAFPNDEGDGTGVAGDPWVIDAVADWKTFAQTSTYWDTTSDYVELGSDLDFGDATVEFVAGDTTGGFKAQFDGKGYTIRNVLLDVQGTATTDKLHTGFIAFIGIGGRVENLNFVNAVLTGVDLASLTGDTGYTYNGIVAGEMAHSSFIDNCTVTRCRLSLNMDSALAQLGLVGMTVGSANGTVTNCHAVGGLIQADNVASTKELRLGGITGVIATEANPGLMQDCTSTATIRDIAGATVGTVNIGGISGCMQPPTVTTANYINRCSWNGLIDYTTNTYPANGKVPVIGGIVGYTSGPDIHQSSATGKISVTGGGTSTTFYGGGIVGLTFIGPLTGNVTQCFSDITFSLTQTGGDFTNVYYGGAAGINYGVHFTDCYSKGIVYDLTATPITDTGQFSVLGGFFGQARDNTTPDPDVTPVITRCFTVTQNCADDPRWDWFVDTDTQGTYVDCFADSDSLPATSVDFTDGTTAKTYAELVTKSTFSTWANWKQVEGSLPVLKWQTYPLASDENRSGSSKPGSIYKSLY